MAKNVKHFTQYLINPTRETNVNYMVGYNTLESRCIAPPDKSFVKIEVERVGESDIPRRYNGVDFWVRILGDGTYVEQVITSSYTFRQKYKLLFIIYLKQREFILILIVVNILDGHRQSCLSRRENSRNNYGVLQYLRNGQMYF